MEQFFDERHRITGVDEDVSRDIASRKLQALEISHSVCATTTTKNSVDEDHGKEHDIDNEQRERVPNVRTRANGHVVSIPVGPFDSQTVVMIATILTYLMLLFHIRELHDQNNMLMRLTFRDRDRS